MSAGEKEKPQPSPSPSSQTPLELELTRRLTEAVRSMVEPAILIGPNWLRYVGQAKPPHYEYQGAIKFAKATGRPVVRVAAQLLKTVDLASLGLVGKANPQGVILITQAPAQPKADAAALPDGNQANEHPKSS